MNHFLIAILFFSPAALANMAPPVANKIPLLNRWKTPIDYGNSLNGKRLLGQNKTWRGLLTGTIAAGLFGLVIYPFIDAPAAGQLEHFLIGASLGFGALLGDAIESFFKRQIGIKSGEPWLLFDQIDFVIGAMLFSLPFAKFLLVDYFAVVLTYVTMHVVISYISYLLGLKDKPI